MENMPEGNAGNSEYFGFPLGISPEWNPGNLPEFQLSRTIPEGATCQIHGNEDMAQSIRIDEAQDVNQFHASNLRCPHNHYEQQGLGYVTTSVTANEQDVQLNGTHLDWPASDHFRGGDIGCSHHGNLVDTSYATHMNYSVDGFANVNVSSAPNASETSLCLAHLYGLTTPYNPHFSLPVPDHQNVGGGLSASRGNLPAGDHRDFGGSQSARQEGPSAAAIDNGALPPTNPLEQLEHDLNRSGDRIDQACLAQSTSFAFTTLQCHPSLTHTFSAYNSPLNHLTSKPAAIFPQDHTLPAQLTCLPQWVDSENLLTNLGTMNVIDHNIPDASNAHVGGSDLFEIPSGWDASSHDPRPYSFPVPGQFEQPSPDYSDYALSYATLQYESSLKPSSPTSTILGRDPSTWNNTQTPFNYVAESYPSTSDAWSPQTRSSLASHINLPPNTQESRYGLSTITTSKITRGRRPVTRPNPLQSTSDVAQFPNIAPPNIAPPNIAPPNIVPPNIAPQPMLDGPVQGPYWGVTTDPEILNSLKTEKSPNIKKAFICYVDNCAKCFKRQEHAKRHYKSVHCAEKHYSQMKIVPEVDGSLGFLKHATFSLRMSLDWL
ncbi:hypothetical protein PSHT_15735, partial [Puccinia striiformis]